MFVTPIIYPASFVPAELALDLQLNPLTGIIEGFRAAILKGRSTGPRSRVAAGALRFGARYTRLRRSGAWSAVRRHHLRYGAHAMRPIIRVENLRKRYRIGARRALPHAARKIVVLTAPARLALRCPGVRATRGAHDGERTTYVGAARRELRREAGRGARHHRAQRRRQVDPAQDSLAYHRTDATGGPRSTAASAACSRSAPASIRS